MLDGSIKTIMSTRVPDPRYDQLAVYQRCCAMRTDTHQEPTNHQTNQTDNASKIPEAKTPPSTHSVSTNDRQRQYDSQLSTDRTKLATPAHRPPSQSQVTSPRKGRSLRTATATTSKVSKSDRWPTRTIPCSAQQPGQRHPHLIYKLARLRGRVANESEVDRNAGDRSRALCPESSIEYRKIEERILPIRQLRRAQSTKDATTHACHNVGNMGTVWSVGMLVPCCKEIYPTSCLGPHPHPHPHPHARSTDRTTVRAQCMRPMM